MYSCALYGIVEGLALDGGNLELLGRGLARAIRGSKRAGAPGRAAVDLAQVRQLSKGLGVSQRDVDDAVVRERGQGSEGGRLLAAAKGAGGDEEAGFLTPEAARGPDSTSLVPESLSRSWVS